MKKQRKSPQKRKPDAAALAHKAAREAENARMQSRRAAMMRLRNYAIALPVVGLVGFGGYQWVSAGVAEADLSRIGRGTPAVVQVHDPQCALCLTLQRQTRRALRDYQDDDVVFLVANLDTTSGQALAARHGATHVMLLLFDPVGELTEIVRGPLDDDILRRAVQGHVERYM